jgi:hypothetical protein
MHIGISWTRAIPSLQNFRQALASMSPPHASILNPQASALAVMPQASA